MTENDILFEEMPIHKAVLYFTVPTVMSQIITVIYNIADTFFIGQLNDANIVAAVTIAMPAFVMLTALSNLFGIGGAGNIARCIGKNDIETAKKSAVFSIWTSVIAAFCYGIAIFFTRKLLLPLLGTDEYTYDFCSSYIFWTITIGAVPTVLNTVLAHIIRAEGYTKQASFGIALGGILNMILDPLFLFVFSFGIKGAAIATMLSNTAAMLYFLLFYYKIQKHTVICITPKYYSIQNGILYDVVVGGLPSFIMMLLGCFSNGVLNRLITSYSNEAMAGMGIAKKIDMIAFAVAQGITQGILPFVAYHYSSGNRKRMKSSISITLTYSVMIACTATIILFVFASPIVKCFINDDKTIYYGQNFLKIICFTCPSTAINFMIITIFQATKQKIQPLILSFLRKGSLDIPLMLILRHFLGINGIAWATPMGDYIALVVSILLFIPYYNTFKNI